MTVESASLNELLISQSIETKWVAVAINASFIPKSQYEKAQLQENDRIEVVTPHPGG